MRVDSFILYTSQRELVETLDDNDAGVLLKNIYKYVSGEDVQLTGVLNVVFITIRQQLDRNAEKYQAFCQKQSENGKKGGRPKRNENPKNPSLFLENPKNPSLFLETQKSLNDNVNDNVNDNKKENIKKKKTKFIKPTIEDIENYCTEQDITTVDASQFYDYYESKGWMIGKSNMKDWKATVRNWNRINKKESTGTNNGKPKKYNPNL